MWAFGKPDDASLFGDNARLIVDVETGFEGENAEPMFESAYAVCVPPASKNGDIARRTAALKPRVCCRRRPHQARELTRAKPERAGTRERGRHREASFPGANRTGSHAIRNVELTGRASRSIDKNIDRRVRSGIYRV